MDTEFNSSQLFHFGSFNSEESILQSHFMLTPKKQKRKCNLCYSEYPRTTSTPILKRHLTTKHPGGLSTSTIICPPTMVGSRKMEPAELVEFNKLIIKSFIDNNIPFKVLDSLSFKNSFLFLNKSAKIVCSKTAKIYLQKYFLYSKQKIINKLTNFNHKFHLTIDIWTGLNLISYIAITIHYIDNEWQAVSFLLDLIYFPHPHENSDVSNIIIDCLKDYKILKNLISVTSDSGSNMVGGCEVLRDYFEKNNHTTLYNNHCLAHVINIIVSCGLKNFEKSLEKVHEYAKLLHKSPKAMEAFAKIAKRKIPLSVPTRWNTTYDMLHVFLQHLDAVEDIHMTLTSEEKEELKKMEIFFKIFYDLTIEISKPSSSIIGLLSLYINKMECELKKYTNEDGLFGLASRMMLEKLSGYKNILGTFGNYCSCLLDPRVKLLIPKFFNQPGYFERFKNLYKDYVPDICDGAINAPLQKALSLSVLILNEFCQESPILNDEIGRYMSDGLADTTTDVMAWWRINEYKYMGLAQMAKVFLGRQIISVPCERIFSRAQDTLSKKRNKLAPKTLKYMMCLDSWRSNILTYLECDDLLL